MVSNSLTASESCPNRRPPPDDFYTPFVMTSGISAPNLTRPPFEGWIPPSNVSNISEEREKKPADVTK